MKVAQLKEYDSSLNFIKGNPDVIEIIGISHSDAPEENTLVFVKGYRFLKNLGRKSENKSYLSTGLVIQADYFTSLGDSEKDEVLAQFFWVATTEKVDHSMCKLSKPFYDQKFKSLNYQADGRNMGTAKIDPTAEIAQNVFIGEDVEIGADVIIMAGCNILPKVKIGKGTILYPNITIYPYCEVGENCRIHAGTVIGTDGFGYNFFDGKHHKIWHLAGVKIKDEVEIGCNAMLDAGAFTPTEIGNGTKIDNDVQISHNVKVHEHVIICGKTGLAGSVEVHNYCAFGAGAGVAPSAIIEQGAQVAARAVVSENAVVKAGEIVGGHPARPLQDWMRSQATLRKLSKK